MRRPGVRLVAVAGVSVAALVIGRRRLGEERPAVDARSRRLLHRVESPTPAAVGLALSVLPLPVFAREASRVRDSGLFWTLVAAHEMKLLGAVARQHVVYNVYDGVADAHGYYGRGSRMAARFRSGELRTELESYTGSDFLRLVTGVVHTVVGPRRLNGYLVFSSLAFWGVFSFYRAFALALPHGGLRGYARLVFFTPSLIFWPASPGKEAWMVFSLGIGALGTARSLTGPAGGGLALAALGMILGSLVRPHVAGMLAAGVASAHLVGRPDGRSRRSTTARAGSRLATAGAVACILPWGRRFLSNRRITTDGVLSVLEQVSRRTSMGGSRFEPPILRSRALAPLGPGTVLFRPHLLEAHNLQARIAAVETTFFLALSIARLRWALAAVGRAPQQPYVAFALVYSSLFAFGHSTFANLGLLSRQRSQLLPLYFVLMSVPPRR
jgi:hypothetical protein